MTLPIDNQTPAPVIVSVRVMSNEQILTAAIDKALDNGWQATGWWLNVFRTYKYQNHLSEWSSPTDTVHVFALIFDHDFAKALWGEEDILLEYQLPPASHVTDRFIMESWQYHLQRMVIAEDPIKYLGENT
jgi:hypothetical protein